MAWTSMHFAAGMICGGAAAGTVAYLLRRGWRWVPAAMTAGGLWALAPDLPRIFREDYPSLNLAGILGHRDVERALHAVGDLFCFHRQLDLQPREFALLGLGLIVLLYNVSLVLLMLLERRARRRGHRHRSTKPLPPVRLEAGEVPASPSLRLNVHRPESPMPLPSQAPPIRS